MPPIEAKLTSWEIKVGVCENTRCLCELGGVRQTAGLGLSRNPLGSLLVFSLGGRRRRKEIPHSLPLLGFSNNLKLVKSFRGVQTCVLCVMKKGDNNFTGATLLNYNKNGRW